MNMAFCLTFSNIFLSSCVFSVYVSICGEREWNKFIYLTALVKVSRTLLNNIHYDKHFCPVSNSNGTISLAFQDFKFTIDFW